MTPEFRTILSHYRRLSDAAKRKLPCELGLRYGAYEDELLHYFPTRRPHDPLLIYIHGGHWQELSIDDSCFAAEGLVEQGAAFAAVGYGSAPRRTLDAMTASVARALKWVFDNSAALGVDSRRVHAAGSSAGAHLLAMALGAAARPPAVQLAGVTLLSGIYELSTIRLSYVNAVLKLSETAARRNSPIHCLPLAARKALLACGEIETAEYRRQHELMLNEMRRASAKPATVQGLICAGCNHFDLPLGLGDPRARLGLALRDQMGLE